MIYINNLVSTKFSVNVAFAVKGIDLQPYNFLRYSQCRVQEVWLVLIFLKEEGL